jgi:hypothetical protein
LLAAYRKPLGHLDKTLTGALDSTESKILHQFLKLKGKAGRAENFRTGILDRHERILVDALYPHRGLQERTLSCLPALAAYGPELLDDLAGVSVISGPEVETVAGSDDAVTANAQPCSHQHHVVFT